MLASEQVLHGPVTGGLNSMASSGSGHDLCPPGPQAWRMEAVPAPVLCWTPERELKKLCMRPSPLAGLSRVE